MRVLGSLFGALTALILFIAIIDADAKVHKRRENIEPDHRQRRTTFNDRRLRGTSSLSSRAHAEDKAKRTLADSRGAEDSGPIRGEARRNYDERGVHFRQAPDRSNSSEKTETQISDTDLSLFSAERNRMAALKMSHKASQMMFTVFNSVPFTQTALVAADGNSSTKESPSIGLLCTQYNRFTQGYNCYTTEDIPAQQPFASLLSNPPPPPGPAPSSPVTVTATVSATIPFVQETLAPTLAPMALLAPTPAEAPPSPVPTALMTFVPTPEPLLQVQPPSAGETAPPKGIYTAFPSTPVIAQVTVAPVLAPTQPVDSATPKPPSTTQDTTTTAAGDCSQYQSTVVLNDMIRFSYVATTRNMATGEPGTISMEVIYSGLGYVAIGFSEDGNMDPTSQAVIGEGPGKVTKYNILSKALSGIRTSPSQTLTNASLEQTETETILRFTKLVLEEGEVPIKVGGEMTNVIWAIGSSNELGYHTARGTSPIIFEACVTA